MQISRELRESAEKELESGEELVWFGSPDPMQQMVQGLPIFLFGIPFLAFSLFWIWSASSFRSAGSTSVGGIDVFPFFGIPFVLTGLGVMSTPLRFYLSAKSTIYAITNNRLLIIQAGKSKSVQSFQGADLANLQRFERPDGSGTLAIELRNGISTYRPNTIQINYSSTAARRNQLNMIRLVGIPDVRGVEKLVLERLINPATTM